MKVLIFSILLLFSSTYTFDIEFEDISDPLIMTPFIKNGNIKFARHLARVPITEHIGIKSYSGFFNVDKSNGSNQFFWYFPPLSNNVSAPVILWLQGGPGKSSMFGLFIENGPIMIEHGTLRKRHFTWANEHHVIYIDNPVGTGFSFTNESGYLRDIESIAEQLYTSLQQFYQLFPELRANKLFLAGETYAGKYVMVLGYTILKNNADNKNIKINMRGLAVGNAFCDPHNQIYFGRYLFQLGLIDENGLAQFLKKERKIKRLIEYEKYTEAFESWKVLFQGQNSIYMNLTGLQEPYNFLNIDYESISHSYSNFLQSPEVRNSIHVGDLIYREHTPEVEENLVEDIMKSVRSYIIALINCVPILFYSGQLDVRNGFANTLNFIKKLTHPGALNFHKAPHEIWIVSGDLAGYVRTNGNLTLVLVRSAGQFVHRDQPKWALNLITKFILGRPIVD